MKLCEDNLIEIRKFLYNMGKDLACEKPVQFSHEVSKVLEFGNENPGKDTGHVGKHIDHAKRHWVSDGYDETTGLSHRTHCAARLILALLELMKEGETE